MGKAVKNKGRRSNRSRTKKAKAIRAAMKRRRSKLDNLQPQPSVVKLEISDTNEQNISASNDHVAEMNSTDMSYAWGTNEEFISIKSEQLVTEVASSEEEISGYRIVDIEFLLK